MMLAGGAVALIGIAYLMTAGGSEDTGGTSGGGGLLMPGQGVSMAPAPVSGEAAAPMTYNLSLPENPVAPAMMAVPAPYIPQIPDGYSFEGRDYGTKKSAASSDPRASVSIVAPPGGVVKTSQGYAPAPAPAGTYRSATPGTALAPGVTFAVPTVSKKDDSVSAAAAGVGFGAGLAASPLGGLASAIGGLFGW